MEIRKKLRILVVTANKDLIIATVSISVSISVLMVVSCTPYRGQEYSQAYSNNGTVLRPFITQTSRSSNTAIDAYYPTANIADNDINRPTYANSPVNNSSVVRPFITQTGNTNNSSVARPFITQTGSTSPNNSNTTNAYYSSETPNNNTATLSIPRPINSTTPVATNYNYKAPIANMSVEPGVKALLECTAELGYTAGFTANDYQYCLQMTQASLSDSAFQALNGYVLSWTDAAINQALQTLGFMNSRSLANAQVKSSQLTSIISTSYRWYN